MVMPQFFKGMYMYRNFHYHGEHLLEYLVWCVVASHQESWFEAFSLVNTVVISTSIYLW